MTHQDKMYCVHSCANRGPAPIPQEGKWDKVKEIKEIYGLTHGVGGCAPQQGTCKLYGSIESGPRYLEIAEGYVLELGLDKQNEVIGYKFVNLGKMMNLIRGGAPADEAFKSAVGTYGRFKDAVRTVDPRKE